MATYLRVSQDLENPSGQIIALNCLGELFRRTKQYARAISCLRRSLLMARKTKELVSVGIASGNLGSVYGRVGNYPQALTYHQEALRVTQSISDRPGILLARVNLTLTYLALRLSRTWQMLTQGRS